MIFLLLNLLWLVPLALLVAILRVSKREIPPVFNCPKCAQRALFIRDRGFEDGSGLVFTCKNEWCSNHHLYFYFPASEISVQGELRAAVATDARWVASRRLGWLSPKGLGCPRNQAIDAKRETVGVFTHGRPKGIVTPSISNPFARETTPALGRLLKRQIRLKLAGKNHSSVNLPRRAGNVSPATLKTNTSQ